MFELNHRARARARNRNRKRLDKSFGRRQGDYEHRFAERSPNNSHFHPLIRPSESGRAAI